MKAKHIVHIKLSNFVKFKLNYHYEHEIVMEIFLEYEIES